MHKVGNGFGVHSCLGYVISLAQHHSTQETAASAVTGHINVRCLPCMQTVVYQHMIGHMQIELAAQTRLKYFISLR